MEKSRIIGKVSATEKAPSTTDEFYFWTNTNEILSPFDFVKAQNLPNQESTTFAVIEEINHVTDAQSHFSNFISSDFGRLEPNIGNMNRLGMNFVKAKVVRNTENIYMPLLDGTLVELCSAEEIRTAMGQDKVKNPIVCGYLQMYKGEYAQKVKVELDARFLIGPESAHMNVSGISGLAAKTSYSMFLLNAIQQTYQMHGEENDVAFVFFNVKGRDLVAIDEENRELKENDKKVYKELGLAPRPFKNVTYYYPYRYRSPENVSTCADPKDVKRQKEANKAYPYKFPFDSLKEKLDLLLANEDDATGTMESCVNYIVNGQGKFANIHKWESLQEQVTYYANSASADGSKLKNEILSSSWKKFLRIFNKTVNQAGIFNDVVNDNERDLTAVIRNDLHGGQVMMIDIANLEEGEQSFVFGAVTNAIWDMKFFTDRPNIPKKVIIFVDELNKYASSDTPKNSPILHQLLDITERGRSLGIILFSVEQFRSAIHDRVKGNCATAAYGCTTAIEISKPDYRYIPKTYQNMMTRLPPGEYIINNPILPSLVKISFPFNTYRQFPNG